MTEQLTDRQLRELDRKKEWCLTILRFLIAISKHGQAAYYEALADSVMHQYTTKDLKAMRFMTSESIGRPRGLAESDVRELNAILRDKFGEDLDTRTERKGRRPSPERLAEYEQLEGFFCETYTYLVEIGERMAPDGSWSDPREWKWRGGPYFSQYLSGLRQAVVDDLEATKDLSKDQVDVLDRRLAQKGLITLTEMRSRVWKTIPKILKRGRIRNDEEYYLLKEKVIDMADTTLDDESRKFADHLLFEYEFGPKRESNRGSRRSAPKQR